MSKNISASAWAEPAQLLRRGMAGDAGDLGDSALFCFQRSCRFPLGARCQLPTEHKVLVQQCYRVIRNNIIVKKDTKKQARNGTCTRMGALPGCPAVSREGAKPAPACAVFAVLGGRSDRRAACDSHQTFRLGSSARKGRKGPKDGRKYLLAAIAASPRRAPCKVAQGSGTRCRGPAPASVGR